ncbi:hypothetical protein [Sporosarcina sp. P3]|uniref:hypothetical protein n=1 Tax=Sporosarcina sp. P3 TaxID=2048245 RepID=UPI001304477D|nr:hypothetical protein [Sporosarcina sp. P3]
MIDRENTCKACEGNGMLSDDEGWQYGCSICRGTGYLIGTISEAEIKDTDVNNRLLD